MRGLDYLYWLEMFIENIVLKLVRLRLTTMHLEMHSSEHKGVKLHVEPLVKVLLKGIRDIGHLGGDARRPHVLDHLRPLHTVDPPHKPRLQKAIPQ